MAITNTPPPPTHQPSAEQREQQARLTALEQRANSLQNLVTTARKDSDFDLFFRRLQMTENFSTLPPEALKQIYLADFYSDFWNLAGEAHRKTKFAEEEKNIARQVSDRLRLEQNPARRQYLALALIVFGEHQEAQRLLEQNLLPLQLQADWATFMKWNELANNPLSPKVRAIIARNEQIVASLQDKYSALIQKHSRAVINEKACPRVRDYKIWFCWLQGEENMPPIIRCCYNSLKQNAGSYKIVFLDEKNFSRYVDIAPHIMDKFRAGKISRTHFSDILRVNLLERHGGLWLDSTILVTESLENHKDLWNMDFFTRKIANEIDLHNPNHKYCVAYGRWATYIQGTAILHNPLFAFERDFYNTYWHDFDDIIDYLLMDFMMALAYDNIPVVQKEMNVVPINNIGIHFMRDHLNKPYAEYPFDKVLKDTFLHKLSWKVQLDMKTPGTVFREIQRRYS